MRTNTQLAVAGALTAALGSSGFAAVINVPGDQPTIQAAISNASSGDEIVVGPGTWDGFTVESVGSALDLTIRSTNPNAADVILSTVIATESHIRDSGIDTTVSGFTFANIADGAITVGTDAKATISNCSFMDNASAASGYLDAGAINSEQGFLKIVNCSFVRNSGGSGGAIGLNNAEAEIIACMFIGNEASTSGGAIYSWSPIYYFTVDDCRFQGNSAQSGGALYLESSSLFVVRNSEFSDNSAGTGGAVHLTFDAALDITDTTMSANTASAAGGGLYAEGASTATFATSLLCANLPDQVSTASGGAVAGSATSSAYCPPPSLTPPYTSPFNCPADISGPDGRPDGSVDFSDLIKLLVAWGACPDC